MTAYQSEPLLANVRILVVDDDPSLLVLIGKMLERVGPVPTMVETGTGALSLLQQTPFDLLILDLMLPDIDGFEILKTVRNDSRFDAMPILILSAKVDDESIQQGLELGADSYITKPYMSRTLIDRVKALIQQGRAAS